MQEDIRISEAIIDRAAEQIGAEDAAEADTLRLMQEEQPMLLAYLTAEPFEALSAREQEYMLYLALVIFLAVRSAGRPPAPIDPERLAEAEEHNWALLAESPKRLFHERMDVFFESSDQEDLLAFVEDALADDEDGWSTREGREAMFVSLKSIIDCLISSA